MTKKNSGRWPSITFRQGKIGCAKIEGPDAEVLVNIQLALTDNENYPVEGPQNKIKVTDLITNTESWLPPTQAIRVIKSLKDKVKNDKSSGKAWFQENY